MGTFGFCMSLFFEFAFTAKVATGGREYRQYSSLRTELQQLMIDRLECVQIMPERLLSVISGILAGGIPGFRIELCCFYHPLTWPLCVVLCFLGFASFSVAILIMTHKMSSCMLFSLLVAIPLLCVFCLVWFGCGCVCFVCLVAFVFGLCFLFLDGTAHWTAYRSLPVLLWLSTSRQPCMIITIHLFAANVCNDLAEAMRRRWTEKKAGMCPNSVGFFKEWRSRSWW